MGNGGALRLRFFLPNFWVADSTVPEAVVDRMRMESHLTVRKTCDKAVRLMYCELLAAEHGVDREFVKRAMDVFGCSDRYCRQFRDVIVNGTPYLKQCLYMGEKIRVGEAAHIANTAPGDEAMQKVLLKEHLEKREMKRKLSARSVTFPSMGANTMPCKPPASITAASDSEMPCKPAIPEMPCEESPAVGMLLQSMRQFCANGKLNLPDVSKQELLSLCHKLMSMYGEV
ncbi:hypothetical protein C818_02677 [Lachnospiraceae bacterium MD308]|nr:hypothetical protein C818_02677 [Lachnospiraceae bacterium MD308]